MIRKSDYRRTRFVSLLTASALLLGACTQNIEVPATVPTPLMAAIPVTVGVYYAEDFQEFLFIEKPLTGPDVFVTLGDANVNMFSRMVSSVFERSVTLDTPTDGKERVDAVLAPTVDEYAFLTPEQAGVNFYSVSIRYKIDLLSPSGDLLDSWTVDSYGRTRATGITGNNSLQQANEEALRDAAAVLALGIQERPSVQSLIGSKP